MSAWQTCRPGGEGMEKSGSAPRGWLRHCWLGMRHISRTPRAGVICIRLLCSGLRRRPGRAGRPSGLLFTATLAPTSFSSSCSARAPGSRGSAWTRTPRPRRSGGRRTRRAGRASPWHGPRPCSPARYIPTAGACSSSGNSKLFLSSPPRLRVL